MTETTTDVAAAAPATASPAKTPKKAKATKGEVKRKPVTHPPASEMVLAAIEALNERKGSSLQAIKKYIAANYKCDLTQLSIFIRKALTTGVEKGTIVQTKGSGAKGSFKLKEAKKPRVKKEKKAKKAGEKKKAKKPAGEKAKKATPKKPAKKAKAAGAKAAKKAGAVKKATTPKQKAAIPKQKATTPSKVAAKTPKTPKPKKAATAAKKAAPKKFTPKK